MMHGQRAFKIGFGWEAFEEEGIDIAFYNLRKEL